MSRPWPDQRPRPALPVSGMVLLAIAVGSGLVLIVGVVLILVAPSGEGEIRTAAGDALFAGRDVAGAIDAWREELGRGPSAELWSRIGIGEIARGRMDDARDAFEQALALDPQRVDALVNLARIDAPGDLAGALARLDQAQAIEPGRPGIRLVRGQFHLDAGDAESARDAFVDELNLNPSSAAAWMGLRQSDRLLREGARP